MKRSHLVSAVVAAALSVSALAFAVTTSAPSAHASTETFNPHYFNAKGKINASVTNSLMTYHGGPVSTAPVVYINYWGSQWNTGFTSGSYTSAQAQTYLNGFFSGVGGSSWHAIDSQYCQGVAVGATSCPAGSAFVGNQTGSLAGTWVDTTALPKRIGQSDIANAATRLMQHFGYNANAIYFVMTPSGHSMSGFGTQWCAWHDEPTSGTQMAYAYMPYIPDAGTSCGRNFVNGTNDSFGNGYFDGFSIVGGHEYAEAMTDPHPERTSTSFGWITSTGSTGQENGDLCAWASNSTNITLGTHYFAVQPIYSNASSSCVTSY